MKEKITYVMDPLCGWSYANSANFLQFYSEYNDVYEFEILLGGIKINNQVSIGGGEMAEYVKAAGARIEKRTGAVFSAEYFKNLASNPQYIFDSRPSSKAIVAMKLLNKEFAIPFAHCLQVVQFKEGRDINSEAVLVEVASEFDVDKDDFIAMYRSELVSDSTNADFATARRMKVDSFPCMYISIGESFKPIGVGYMTVEEMRKAISFCFVVLTD